MPSKLDSVTVEVIHHHLLAAAKEMNRNLIRTSYNTVVYEVQDFGLGIYDRRGRLLAEAPGLAVFTRGNDYGIDKMLDFLGEDFLPGDLILLNYPYWSSAHILDVMAASPIFFEGCLMGFTAVKMHWLDLGQKDAGYCLDTTSIYQEGLILPCVKIYKGGVLNQELENIIRFNSRLPERVIGDMNAQISSCRTGEKRVVEMVRKFGPDVFELAIEEILDHGERLARSRLAALPNGTWTAEDWVDDDGVERDTPVKLQVTVTITDDEMHIDFTGSDEATKGPINLPVGMTTGVAALAFKAVTTPDTHATEGNFRPLRVTAPAGSVTHAIPPSPTFTLWTGLLAVEVITKAMSQGMPDIVPACSGGDVFGFMGVGVHPDTGKMWLEGTNEGVGFGGHSECDGEDGIMHISEPGCRNNPVEILENKAPLLIENYGLRQDSGGAGMYRGGLGVERTYRFLADASALIISKKSKTKPWGMESGQPGQNGYATVWPGTDREYVSGMLYQDLRKDDRLTNRSGGGGGWGDPMLRDPKKVLADVRSGFVSIKGARDDYRVVIDPDTLDLDVGATLGLRDIGD